MTIKIELFEDYGPIDGGTGRGTGTKQVFEAVLSDEEPSAFSVNYGGAHSGTNLPGPGGTSYTYHRNFFAKISGTWERISRIYWYIENTTNFNSTLQYVLTNSYVAPSKMDIAGTDVIGPITIDCNLSATGPQNATSFSEPVSGTYFTQYLRLQHKFGHTPVLAGQMTDPISINLVVVEKESD